MGNVAQRRYYDEDENVEVVYRQGKLMAPTDRLEVLLDLATRALNAPSESDWWSDVAASVTGPLFSADVMALNVVNVPDSFGWFGLVFPEAVRVRMPVNSPMDYVLTHEHPFTLRMRAGPVTEPMQVTDLISARRWRDQAAYERMRYLTGGVHHMIIHLPRMAPYVESVSVVRADRTYNAAEMQDAAQPQTVLQLSVRHLRHVGRRQRRWGPLREQEAASAAAALGVSPRERAVLDLLAAGAATTAIAERLGIAPRTVYRHEQRLYRRLGVTDGRNAVLRAHRLGLLPAPAGIGTASAPFGGGLTPREDAVLNLLATGMTNAAIADALDLSTRTVDIHVSNLLRKLHARTRTEAAVAAARAGLLALAGAGRRARSPARVRAVRSPR